MARHIAARALHDLGLATWFGGAVMGAVGLNGAAATLRDPDERLSSATAGWSRFAQVNAVAIGAHLVGATRLLHTERGRLARQRGVGSSSAVKTVLTGAALVTTAYSGLLNRRMAAAGRVPVLGATEPGPVTPPEVAAGQRRLRGLQWLIPALTGSLIGVTAWQSEQMRPRQMLAGVLPELHPRAVGSGATVVAAATALAAVTRRRTAAAGHRHDRDVSDIAAQSRRTAASAEPPATTLDNTSVTVTPAGR